MLVRAEHGRVHHGRLAELATPRLHRPELPRVHPREPPAPPPSPWPLESLLGPSSPSWRAATGEQQLPPLQPPPARGQAAVGHLGPSRGLRRVRKGPLVLPRPSAADDVPSPAGFRELRRPPLLKSRQGPPTRIRRSSGS